MENVLISSKLTAKLEKRLNEILSDNDQPLFVVVSDLDGRGEYGRSLFVATRTGFFVYDATGDKIEFSAQYSECDSLLSKRMYSNGTVRVKLK